MPTPFYAAYINGMAKAPVQEWQEGYQAAADDFWDNTSTVRTIQSQTAVGSHEFAPEDVQVTSILNPKTGKDIGDDWREIVHKVYVEQTNYTGKLYQFDGKTWIATNTNKREGSVRTSIVRRCNQTLKWVAGNELKQWACAFTTDFNYISPNYGTEGVPIIKADAMILVQQNTDTAAIPYNQRFLFNGKAYITVQTNPHIIDTYLVIYVNATQIEADDDVTNNIANASAIQPVQSAARILPSITKILQGKTQEYSVYAYADGTPTAEAFTITASQAPADCYELTVIDGNHFTIKNLVQSPIPIIVRCVGQTSGTEIEENIVLGGAY